MSDKMSIEAWILLILAAVAGVRTVLEGVITLLRLVAPRTSTTLDDRALAGAEDLHRKLDELIGLLRPTPVSPAKLGPVAIVAVLLLGGLALGGSGCGSPGARAENAAGAALGCTMPLAVSLGAQLKPTLLQTLAGVISGDGLHVDRARLKAAAAPMRDPALRCAFEAALAYFTAPVTSRPGAPAAEALDTRVLAATWLEVRAELGWGVQ